MEIEHCPFPDELEYDASEGVWVKLVSNNEATVGITSILAALAGKLTSVKFKPLGESLEKGKSVAIIESPRFVGAVRTPLSGKLVECNKGLISQPKLGSNDPYGEGWMGKLRLTNLEAERHAIRKVEDCKDQLLELKRKLRIKCYSAFPDHGMYEVGAECAAVLVRLNELMSTISVGDVVLVVSDEPTADIEMVRWSDQTGQKLLETRREDKIYHLLIKKIR